MTRKNGTIAAAIVAALIMGGTVAGCGSDSSSVNDLKNQANEKIDQAQKQLDKATGNAEQQIQEGIDNADAESVQKALQEARKQLEELQNQGN